MSGIYRLELTKGQDQEVEDLIEGLFDPAVPHWLSRRQWMAVGQMALGKAQLIEAGQYGESVDLPEKSADAEDNARWAAELRVLAGRVHQEFKPGDGRY